MSQQFQEIANNIITNINNLSTTGKVLCSIGSLVTLWGTYQYFTYKKFVWNEKRFAPYNKYTEPETAIEPAKDKLKNSLALITGCNTGIGLVTAKYLAKYGCTVIMACRKDNNGNNKAKSVINNIDNNIKNLLIADNELTLDLGDYDTIKPFVDTFLKKYGNRKLNYLINNAGVMAIPDYQVVKVKNDDVRIEKQFGVNHLAHFYLTNLLLDKLKKDNTLVINVSSSAHRLVDKRDITALNIAQTLGKCLSQNEYIYELQQKSNKLYKYNAWIAYGYSKISNIYFSRYLVSKYNIKSCSLHPGAIQTELSRNMSPFVKLKFVFMNLFFRPSLFYEHMKSLEQGASTTLRCVSLDANENSNIENGVYYYNTRNGENKLQSAGIRPNVQNDDDKSCGKDSAEAILWSLSEQLLAKAGYSLNE